MRAAEVLHAGETSIATGLVAPPVLAAGHCVDSGVGPRELATGARGSDLHTSRLIHCQVVADKSVGVAVRSLDVGQCDLCGGG